ncbi:hypothetical protein [Halobiforma nitratireducens]|uniref:hypothetical protein n=1 Tax=Halobiforma nitratireducens TaxID=130048 RepID=UPI00126797C2|nr:hypothetical protein [Halobiforma nitratireducens]
MKRRTVLSSTVTGFCLVGVGYLSNNDEGGCPDNEAVEIDLEDELSYVEYNLDKFHNESRGIYLITETDDIDTYTDDDVLNSEDRQWIEETDFSESVVLALQVISSRESSEPLIHGVEREYRIEQGEGRSDETFHVYSCIARSGDTDDSEIYARLLRVPHGGEPPDSAGLTHWEDSSFFES